MKKAKGKDQVGGKRRVVGFQVVENECIWMKAGVVNFRQCDNGYDCGSCPFDKGMRKAMGVGRDLSTEEAAPRWVEYLQKTYEGSARPCRHALTGRIDAPKICTQNYECYHCAFDQMLDQMDLSEEIGTPRYSLAAGYRLAEGYYYHMGHTWARFEHGGRVRVGFDDFMVKLFGAAQVLTLPPLGEALQQNAVGWTFRRDKHRAALLSPITGTVLALNHKAAAHPEITHEDPYGEGWLFILEPEMPKQNLKGLYFGNDSFNWMEREAERLMRLLGGTYENLSATGGVPVDDVYGNLPLDWSELVREFLRTGER